MKILIKANKATYELLEDTSRKPVHVAGSWNFQIRQTLIELGHFVNFIGATPLNEIQTSYEGYDVLFFHQLPSFTNDKEYSKELLRNFKGIKIYYSPNFCGEHEDIFPLFDYIFTTGTSVNYMKWKNKYPSLKVSHTIWQAPRFDIVDQDFSNPYDNSNFKLIYCGIIIDKYLDYCKKLAEKDEVYIGGLYYSKQDNACRDFKEEETKDFPSNLKLINSKGTFVFGEQFKYIKHANLGLVFQEVLCFNSLRHKLVEYLVCGLPCVVEESTSNAHWVTDFDAGHVFEFGNFSSLQNKVDRIKERYYDKMFIQQMARERFSQHNIYKEMLERISC